MLCRFEVSGFKGFEENFVFDLLQSNSYEFNKEAVKNGVIKSSIIYGKNGCGKTNLSFALFDIVTHLVDRTRNFNFYAKNYLNASSKEKVARFTYRFKFDEDELVYSYEKLSSSNILKESIAINGKLYVSVDRAEGGSLLIDLPGTKSLKRDLGLLKDISGSEISVVSYIASNSLLPDSGVSLVFKRFYKFVQGMLFFRSLEGNSYVGLSEASGIKICSDIAERGNVKDFEKFLNSNGIECKLEEVKDNDGKNISFKFGKALIPFSEVASTGTKTLGLFYFWMQRMKKDDYISLACIDEFDAFYHHELAVHVVEILKKVNSQVILTTHNTSIMTNDLLRADCYFVMNNKKIVSLSDSTSKEIRQAHNLEKIYKAGGFSVEGHSNE
ncbi:AAA family ATPase [Pseudomonas allokribbensis]|uniref:AAA family ATPase n=1 Tax=Pseudomonas allokribbensis TaxID=2774460 RepID=UPI0017885F55|nr:AAA family ATPase [Pseudomonas allokribbensis]